MTVAELRRRMSHREWIDWQAYYVVKSQREEVASKKAKRGRG